MDTDIQRERAFIGRRVEELDTPALLLDGPAAERNIRAMADFFRGRHCQLRPHFKNHKCVTLARRQLEAGSAVGMTCAKLGEAEVLAEHGFEDILIANQVVGEAKMARAVEVAKRARLSVAVDDFEQAAALSAAAGAAGQTIGVLVEVDGGMGRCGVDAGAPAVGLVERLIDLPGIDFRGIQCFEGHTVYENDADHRAGAALASMRQAVDTRRQIEAAGTPVAILSGGASSTYRVTGALEGVDELQAGTYPTMDWRYQEMVPEFELALSVLARVISVRPERVVVDVGVKGAGGEFGPPRIFDTPGAEVPWFLSEEHCVIRGAPALWKVGQAVRLLPSHACTTCNLYRTMFVHEDGRVVDVWPIEASGALR